MSNSEPVYLIDGSAYIYRAYHAIAPLSNKDGLPTHAAFGFTNILLRVLKEKSPKYVAMAFDLKGPTFRHEEYADYKANRPPMPDDLVPQIPYIKRIAAAHNILCLEEQGLEADDLIAAAARKLTAAGIPVVVVSGDKDLLQLVSDTVTLWEPMNNRWMDPAAVHKKYNVAPAMLTDLFALIGDSADNIPGVPGIGPKTAEQLLNRFGSLDELYHDLEGVERLKLREKLATFREQAFLSRRLIRLRDEVEVPADLTSYQLPQPDYEQLRDLYTELEFSRFLKDEVPAESMQTDHFHLVATEAELAELVVGLAAAPLLALDTETDSLDPLTANLVGISLCAGSDRAWYLPVGHRAPDGELLPGQLGLALVLDALRPLLTDPRPAKVCHNLKFDYAILKAQGVTLAGPLHDTMIASYLLEPSRRSHKLENLCEEYLGQRLTSFAEATGGDKRPDAFAHVALEAARDYACEDAYATFLLWELLRPRLAQWDLQKLYAEVEMPLVPILAEMERLGIRLDPAVLADLSEEFSRELDRLQEEIFRLAGEDFNINSPRQLGEILFDRLKLPHGRKTKTGYSTDAKVLEKLANLHDLPAAVIAHRNLSKLQSTYVEKLATLIHPRTGRVHSSFNQTVTATGRLSSSNPNLQNIPIRTAEGQRIREAFIPRDGYVFLAADYSQIDLRVLAHYSQDAALLAAFRSGADIHRQTAADIFQVNPAMITPEMRRVAKSINFGIVYGMSAFGLAGQLNLSRKEAGTFIDRYFAHYPGVKTFMEQIVRQAKRDGFVTTLLHRRRALPDINSANKTRREFAERTALNTPIQGTAADIIKLATLRVGERLRECAGSADLLLQIHDELVFEVAESALATVEPLVKEAMESAMRLDVPLKVNIATGANLAAV